MSIKGRRVRIDLSGDEALVLFDWLGRTSAADQPAPFVDQAEQRVLWDLECILEATLVEVFAEDYETLLSTARAVVRDEPGA